MTISCRRSNPRIIVGGYDDFKEAISKQQSNRESQVLQTINNNDKSDTTLNSVKK